MKRLLLHLCFAICTIAPSTVSAQDLTNDNYMDRNPIYDHGEIQLNNTDTIPDFDAKLEKLKVSGTIYESDGMTPAKDVILYIEQADVDGDFDLRFHEEKRYVHHRGWIKTDADGKYTFYTFIPGNDRRYNQMQQLFPTIKEPSKKPYEIASFLFDEDPLLSKSCKKRVAKKGNSSSILKLKNIEGLLVAQRDIILAHDVEEAN